MSSFTDCMVKGCDGITSPRTCPGDGARHHHGAIHTVPDTALDLGDWGWLCDEHYRVAEAEWKNRRAST